MLNFKVWEVYQKSEIISVNKEITEKFPEIDYSFEIRDTWDSIELDDTEQELIKFEKISDTDYKCVFDSMAFMEELESVG